LAIFEATERLLGEMPLHDLSVARIIAGAGISRATFYFYFSSKFAVVSGLLAGVMDQMFEGIQPFVRRPEAAPPLQALEESLSATASMWAKHRPALRAVHEHWSSIDELRALWIEIVQRFTEAVAAEIDRERAAGLARPGPDSHQLAATLLWSTEACLYVGGLSHDPNLPSETAAQKLLLQLWAGVLYDG
jgi:AcrR family transcriptional regulator